MTGRFSRRWAGGEGGALAAPALPPIRFELWSGRSLREAGRELAATRYPELPEAPPAPLRRLTENQRAIRASYLATLAAAERGEVLTPAAEWLIDNNHMIEENLRQLRQGFGRRFMRLQQRIALPQGGSVPRSLLLAWYFVAMTNSDVTEGALSEFLHGFQELSTLTIAELWAVPAFLRFVLIENLRRMTDQVSNARELRIMANEIADLVAADPAQADAILAARSRLVAEDSVAMQLLYRFRGGGAEGQEALAALERHRGSLHEVEQAVQRQYAEQSAANVTTGNIVTSLRRMGEIDWLDWFETVSQVDRLLTGATEFCWLDKATRTSYRTAIEKIARRSDLDELGVVQLALDTARADREAGDRDADAATAAGARPAARAHQGADARLEVGQLLVGNQRFRLQRLAGCRLTLHQRLGALTRRLGWWSLQLPLLLLTLGLLAFMGWLLPAGQPGWLTVLLLTAALMPVMEASMQVLAFIVARTVQPRRLPGYDYRSGLPPEARTLVAIPCMLASIDAIDELADTLESHYLANPIPEVFFALLSDWTDAPERNAPRDAALLDHARARIDELAERYDDGRGRRFFLLHRRRQWNPAEGVWMGWERKRGKLVELNMLLRGEGGTSFIPAGPTPPEGIRYVVTLDSDTRLPRDTVAALAGKMAHPVNRPVSRADGVVVEGHAILQPRITPALTTGAEASVFQRAFSANRGLNPYVFAVSDLYQDLFDAGSFTGKGIYDVDAFQGAIAGRIAENTVLSHDLLEGSWARAALVSDVEVVENFPVRYATEARRQHRWMRGDWQLLPLIFDPRNGLGGLSRFKMLDNLRRSLLAPSWLAASLAGWLGLGLGPALLWQAGLFLLMLLGPILHVDSRGLHRRFGVSLDYHLWQFLRDFRIAATRFGFQLATLAQAAWLSLDAILRTLWRLAVTRRHLLEWTPSGMVARGYQIPVMAEYRRSAASPLIGVAATLATAWVNPATLPLVIPFALLWVVAPWIVVRASRPLETEDQLQITPQARVELRRIARRTWAFFDHFVTEATHHLPPDNFQDQPAPKLAERTSPTNIGLYLMSVVSAQDFGWLAPASALSRIEATLGTLERLQRHRGHFYNWYDTRTLEVLPRPYVSAVDSGNLAGMLIALASALRLWAGNAASLRQVSARGLLDTLGIVEEELAHLPEDRRGLRELRRAAEAAVASCRQALEAGLAAPSFPDPVEADQLLQRTRTVARLAEDLRALAQDGAGAKGANGSPEATVNGAGPASENTGSAAARNAGDELAFWAGALAREAADVLRNPDPAQPLDALRARLLALSERARGLAFEMDFALFVDPARAYMSIGYRADDGVLDESRYDLLASEARLTCFLAIAKGDMRKESWTQLGRPFSLIGRQGVLLSWSGSMFEYLMPPLLMKERQGGILNLSNKMAVEQQMAWGRAQGLPWGVSESAFNARDREMNYQYYAFGVPALALKRASGNQVVAPYASILAAQIRPHAAVANLRRLRGLGAEGRYGFYDAVDFTPTRQREGERCSVVRNVMAHHQGMAILAVANAVLNGIHRERFHDDPVVRASELLLQEKAPRDITPVTRAPVIDWIERRADDGGDFQTLVRSPGRTEREVALLSAAGFTGFISSQGTGRAMLGGVALNRWTGDGARDEGGIHLLLRDMQSGEWWSATEAPCQRAGERSAAIFSDHKAEFFKTAQGIESRLEVIAATEGHADGRRLTLRNLSARDRTIDVTSYGEIVLDDPRADRAHPAFSKMFVETEIREDGALILAERQPRDPAGQAWYLAHLVTGPEGALTPATEAETDRRHFIGRGRSLAGPAAMEPGAVLSGSCGHTLDPIFAIRRHVRVPAGKSVSLTFWTLIAESAEERDRLAAHLARPGGFEHELRLSWTWSQVQLRHLGVSLEEAKLFRRFARFLIWPDLRMAAGPQRRQALGPQSALWPMGISGDLPILLVRIDDEADLPILRDVVRMHGFLFERGVAHDLVVLNERPTSYVQELQQAIRTLIETAASTTGHSDPPHAHVVRRDQIGRASFDTLIGAARIMLHTRNGKLADQMARLHEEAPSAAALQLEGLVRPEGHDAAALPPAPLPAPPATSPLQFWNGFGGFSPEGDEYVLRLTRDRQTPHPWINVIAREDFGFHVSAEGAPYTWAVNSRDYQITPWSNDPVSNPPGETLLLLDPETGRVATPFLALAEAAEGPGAPVHEAAHGAGYSRFTADYGWLRLEAVMTLAEGVPARLTRLRVTNPTQHPLALEGLACARLVLGADRTRTAAMVQTRRDAALDAVLARNPFSMEFGARVTALACDRPLDAHCGDLRAFLGPGGSMARPAALEHWPETSAAGSAAGSPVEARGDPCAALRWKLELAPGETAETLLILANTTEEALPEVLQAARAPGAFEHALDAARTGWQQIFDTLQVETPDPKLDLLVNRWLPYQAIACRLRARTGFYQASGAFGFRDQLQDTAALLLQDPALCRHQILNAAARQFREGDMQHWWLPETGAGVRTTISDDVVWLGQITAGYVAATGDSAILDEELPWLEGPELAPEEHDRFFTPERSEEVAPLYEHCARALDLALARTGPQGLPLMLGGDWNDGMNRVGAGGRGESVWLGWFLADTLRRFAPLAEARGDSARAQRWLAHRERLVAALEKAGWDGAWYRRGYYDDGTPLGSAESAECRIDSIAQSWALISGAGDPGRARQAVAQAQAHLFDREARILRLFTPPFHDTEQQPGYIRAYPPGVRENGGQYTHAAAWMIYALALAGDGSGAHALFDALNPISHSLDAGMAETYRVEPYVVAADIYGAQDKLGRGGWTWYTGSAGWMYRAAVEGILGLSRCPGGFTVNPHLPADWPGYRATLRLDGHRHALTVNRGGADGALRIEVDSRAVEAGTPIPSPAAQPS